MDESMRLKILGDASGATSALAEVQKTAELVSQKVSASFGHLGSLFKKTIGWAGVGIGLETALESASKLNNAQKAQSQLLYNQSKQQGSLIKLQDYQLQGAANQYQWKSKTLDQMATELSLSNAIAKTDVVAAQTRSLTNTDLLKFYKNGAQYLGKQNQTYKDIVSSAKQQHQEMSNSQASMATMLTTAANLAEVTHGNINTSMMMLGRLMADPAKRMSSMSRMGIQISKQDQDRIKALEAQKGIMAAQGELMNVLDKTYHNLAATAASPVEILKNAMQNIWTALGQGLMPVLESLSSVVINVVTPLIPILQSMGKLIDVIASSLGASLGNILADLVPFIDLLVKGLIPAFLDIITPLIQIADAILTPLARGIEQLVGSGTKVGPLSKMFITLGETIGKMITPAVKFLNREFKKMTEDGTMQKMMQSILATFKALAPILPELALAFAKLVIAITPAFIASLPVMVQAFKLFADILVALSPLIIIVTNALTKLVTFITGNKGLTDAVGVLIGIWFTRKMFIDPIFGTIDAIGILGGKLGGVLSTVKNIGKGFGTFGILKGAGTVSERTAASAEEVIALEKARRGSLAKRAELLGKDELSKNLLNNKTKLEKDAEKILGRTELQAANGGGFKGLVKSLLGGVGTLGGTDPVVAQNQNTDALISLTNAVNRANGGMFGGGGGNNPLQGIENKLKGKAKQEVKQEIKKLAENAVKKDLEKGAEKGGVKLLEKGGGSLIGKMLPKFGASALTGVAETAAVGGAEIAGVEAGAAALAPETLGLSEVVANVGLGAQMLYTKWKPFHEIVNKSVGLIKNFAMAHINAVKTVAEGAMKVGSKVGGFLKGVIDGNLGMVKKAVSSIGNFVGGIGGAIGSYGGKIAGAMLSLGRNMISSLWSGARGAISSIGGIFGNILGGAKSIVGGAAKGVGNFFSGLMHFHNGGIVPGPRGTEVPAVLQAGEAVVSLNQMRRGGAQGAGGINVSPNAVNIIINGNTDNATVEDIKRHVEDQFRQLRYAARTMGR